MIPDPQVIQVKTSGLGLQNISHQWIVNKTIFKSRQRIAAPYTNSFRPFIQLWLANGNVIGYVALSRYSKRDAYDITAELSVYVKNDCQNRHIGTQLIEYALQEAQKNNRFLTVVSLITSENEHSIYLHKQFGFEFGGRIKNAGFKFDRLLGVDIYYKNFQ